MTEKKFVDGAGLKHFKSKLDALFDDKVDKEAGKSLSTNDFTNAHKSKVDAIPANPKYTDNNTTYKAGDGLSLSGTTFSVSGTIARKTDIPSLEGYAKLTDIPKLDTTAGSIDLSNYVTKDQVDNMFATYNLFLDDKVDKESSKGLSTNDFTNEYKKKIDGLTDIDLSEYALKTDLPNLDEYAKLDQIPNNRANIYDNDTIDYAKAEVGKDWFLRNDGLMGPISSIDREAESLRFSTRFILKFPFARKKDIPDVSGLASKIDLNNKVDKVEGKGLSTNDFTNAYKSKLDGLSSPDLREYVSKYTLENLLKERPGFFTYLDNIDVGRITLSGIQVRDSSKLLDSYLDRMLESYYLSAEGYLAKIRDYGVVKAPNHKDYRPVNDRYIKFEIV